jgi:hypothetical protein
VAAAAIVVGLQAAPAAALVNSVPDPTWMTSGTIVYAVLPVGNIVYVAGHFTQVGPNGLGTPRANLAAFDLTTGEVTSWNPGSNKSVYALAASPDGSVIYAGGTFTQLGGKSRMRLAAIDAATGQVLSNWRPTVNGTVYDLVAMGSRLYVGGGFSSVSGVSRLNLAAIDAASGAVDTTWSADVTNGRRVRAISPSSDGSVLYVGGNFAAIEGQTRGGIGAVDTNTGLLTSWNPGLNYPVLDFVSTPTTVYSGGAPGPLPGGELASIDAATGAVNWRVQADGDMDSIAMLNGEIYVGGHFIRIVNGTTLRNRIAAFDQNGVLDAWNPTASGEVWALETQDNHLFAGGGFEKIGGVSQMHFAEFTDPGM